MLITKETDYALRLLRGLVGGERITVVDLSQNEQVPQQFAYKILKKLQRAGIVRILRGAEGGCMLAKGLDQVTLHQLMQVMEEDSSVISCMRPGFECQWCKAHGETCCRVHTHLATIQKNLERELNAHSLAEIMFGK